MRRLARTAKRSALNHLMINLVPDRSLGKAGRGNTSVMGEVGGAVIFRAWGKRKASMAIARDIFKASILRTGG